MERVFLFGFINCALILFLFLLAVNFMKKQHWVIMNFPCESPSAASLWYSIHLLYPVLTTIPHPAAVGGNYLMSDPQKGLHLWTWHPCLIPITWVLLGGLSQGLAPRLFRNLRARSSGSWNYFLALCPVFSLLCHCLSRGLWICLLSH